MENKIKEKKVKEEIKFRKEDILRSREFSGSTDIVSVILENKKAYSKDEVNAEINKFLKRKVK